MEVLLGIVAALAIGALVTQMLVDRRRPGPAVAEREAEVGALTELLAEQRAELVAARESLTERERRLADREERLGEEAGRLQEGREQLADERQELAAARADLTAATAQATLDLERQAGLSTAEARAEVIEIARAQADDQARQLAREITETAEAEAETRARRIVSIAIERVAVEQASDAVITAVPLASDELKGRIIGREGRNIRAFEQVTGVTLVVDDTPGLVLLSCFEPVRREIARQTLIELLADGRIDPARIEEVHATASANVERSCVQAAESAIADLGLPGIDRGLWPTIGALAYRTSYGQNVLEHSQECARLAGSMAAELGLDVELCRQAAFLHDLGKAVITKGEGSHAAEGAELARRHGLAEEVVHAIAAHHNEIAPQTAIDVITQAADALSSSRPGARRESSQAHSHRLEQLEAIATRQEGVERAYALQAGREIRVMVVPEVVDDRGSQLLARQIAEQVERELVYPGKVKVTVIREVRASELAH